MLTTPDLISTQYSDATVSRFLASYMISIFLGFSAEFFHFRSFNQLATINSHNNKLANTDALTSLPNRRFIVSIFLIKVMENPKAYLPFSMILIDIDNFKEINDTYGHIIGDNVLKHVSDIFNQSLRTSDIFARVGGEEFLTTLPRTKLENSINTAKKTKKTLTNKRLLKITYRFQ